ncbi:MAG: hydroxymethylglutaryl-CoA synthase [Sandaracinaceae bacterium]
MEHIETGIASIGVHLPPLAMAVEELATLRGVDPDKYRHGLGLRQMALCPTGFGVCDLAVEAARRALSRWDGALEDIGLVAVGTETAVDMSRPLSAFVSQALGLRGAIRSYEVKHACYGGTLALQQAVEWRASGAARGKAALVIAADVSLYAEQDPGEPTQGAGAVAMVVGAPTIAQLAPTSYVYSEPAFDFWRPVGQAYPRVDGPLSLDCYKRGAFECFSQLVGERDPHAVLDAFEALCFHVPFPKMVKKAFFHLGERFGWDEVTTARLFEAKVAPTFETNRAVGNAYTASLWLSVASALAGRAEGATLGAFSYGSGFGAELTTLEAGPAAAAAAWRGDLERDLAGRTLIDKDAYSALRAASVPAH